MGQAKLHPRSAECVFGFPWNKWERRSLYLVWFAAIQEVLQEASQKLLDPEELFVC